MAKPTDSRPEFDMPASYRISFRGYLPQSWSDRLNGMAIATYGKTSEEQVLERIGDARFVLVNGTTLSRQAIEAAPNEHVVITGADLLTGWKQFPNKKNRPRVL